MRLLDGVVALLRRRRAERGVIALLFLLVAVTSLVVAASPRLFGRVADDGLRYAVARSTAAQRNIEFSSVARGVSPTGDPIDRVEDRGERLADQLGPAIADLVEQRHEVIDTTRFRLTEPPAYPSFLTLRTQDGVDDQIDIVDGRRPGRLPLPTVEGTPRFEIVLAAPTAAEMGVRVGDVLPAAVDPADAMLRNVFPRPVAPVELALVGLFTARDPAAEFWFDDTVALRPTIGGTDDAPIAFGTALFAPGAFADIGTLGLPNRYRWRFHIDAGRLDAGRLDAAERDLRRLATTFARTGTSGDAIVLRTGLLDLIDRYRTERAVTEATLSVAAIGPLVVAAGALGLVGISIVRRRRAALVLARSRGASAAQVLAAQASEGLLVAVPAALVGLAVATLAVPARPVMLSPIGAALVALTVTGLLIGATWPLARRARRDLERPDVPGRGSSPRRLVVEATVVGVALGAVWLLRERGVGTRASGGGPPGFDPFLAAAPVLLGLAVALLAIRCYPWPVRAVGWLSARRRDLVPVLGLRSIGRNPTAAYLPLLVLTITVAIGVFSSVIAVTIDRGQVAAAWQEVGADYRIGGPNGGPIDASVDPRPIAGVAAAVPVLVVPTGAVAGEPDRQQGTTLVALDLLAHGQVMAGSPLVPTIPAAVLAAPSGDGIGGPEAPIPVIVSVHLPNGWSPLAVGETFQVAVGGRPVSLRVAAFLDAFPGVRRGTTFIVAPLASLAAWLGGPPIRPTAWLVRGGPAAGPALRAALADVPTVGSIVSRDEVLADDRAAPLVGAVGQGFLVALGAAGAYAGLAVVAVIALDAGRRARELAFLRTLGLADRQAVGLTVVEHAPPALLSLVIGLGLGLVVAWLLVPGLGLDAFIGPDAPVVLSVDWGSVGLVVVAVLAVVVGMVVASSWLARRLDPSQALRIGDR
ncbi:MAG TPA: FtsX-like permease family protein [Candidatus Limnocylindrales bacterium]|nr:FtsX-like permease family protein [Candidatus Limnocylindrales bacterium]